MKIDKFTDEMKQQIIDSINGAEDKSTAIADAMEQIASAYNQDTVNQILADRQRMESDAEYREAHGFRALSEDEKKFYGFVKQGPKAQITADQIDIFPQETIDYTLNEVKKASGVTSLINFTPANVKKWLFGSKTGAAAWGGITDAIASELTAKITSLNMDVFKLSAFIVVPKAIRELEVGYVDRYVTAILSEAMQDGIVKGYLNGDGKVAPVGIMRQIGATNSDGTNKAKTKVTTITSFSPKGIAPALKTLSHGGLRTISEIAVIANPADVFDYINPALYGDSVQGSFVQKSIIPVTVYAEENMEQGSSVITAPGLYTMGFQGVKVDEYKETKALDDADVIIAKVYGNGRAVDDDAAVVFDPSKLTEYVIPVKTATAAG
jgi:HK97 family phage major capsid protein